MNSKEWNMDSIENLTKRVKVGFVGSCEKFYCNKSEGIPMIRTTNLKDNGIDFSELKYVTKEFHMKNKKSQLNQNDILVARHGDNGKACLFDKNIEANCLNVIIVEPDETKLLPKFLKYLFDSPIVKNQVSEAIVGSVQNVVNTKTIAKIVVPSPLLSEQKAIADTLSCLDNKIELNNRINKNLEEMAQAIFKSWFVDFEPFQDGEFEDSELGVIPKGWRVGTIGDLVSDTVGGDWGKESIEGNYTEKVTCIRGADIPEISIGKRGKPATRYILKKNLDKKNLTEGQIIIEISGGSPTQSTGRTALITSGLIANSDSPLICTNFCRALTIKGVHHSSFVYSLLQYLYSKDLFFLFENGTTGIKNLDTNNLFSKHSIVIPNLETVISFDNLFKKFINIIYENGSQSEQLSYIRDSLLPKLMSGEIRVQVGEE